MQALYEQQVHLASVFVASNQERVASVTDTAVKMANDLLGRLAPKILLKNSLTNLQSLVEPSKIETFGLRLRQHAIEFVQAGVSGAYWELIDGISALSDATGSRWPYMSQELRSVRLGQALDHFESCSSWLDVEASKLTP
ncbi:TPA: hypothetical protein NHR53_006100 [Pseudomonas aeruginosa]|uniref:hypothetical protein n=1 Tax=Pseudomonas aeruginosa TaxID=287 RepID=UPI000802A02F|nr:hypothetical protein [Pseudomonas aeruginosa]OBY18956.1 hypothetical protein A8O37_30865 [Pseudomonas aeruginosa]HCE7248175.1 hypothetical protein [Pseudomonas aeruginosa]HCE8129505.1 hypothetical protein [Pseudomonas aeruginosa]HCF0447617.1 hypothetical protein [Pseudomonas aeruginosa]